MGKYAKYKDVKPMTAKNLEPPLTQKQIAEQDEHCRQYMKKCFPDSTLQDSGKCYEVIVKKAEPERKKPKKKRVIRKLKRKIRKLKRKKK